MGRYESVQCMRALAALAVVAFHASTCLAPYDNPALEALFRGGAFGVDLFFAISGFIMYTIALDRPVAPGEFLARRLIRVGPLYWIATVAVVLVSAQALIPPITVTPGLLAKSLLFIPYFSPDHPGSVYPLLVPGWTLAYEMFFYLLFALVLASSRRPDRLILLLAAPLVGLFLAGLILAPQGAIARTYTSPLLLEFLGGALVALAWRRGLRLPAPVIALIVLASLGVVALLGRHARTDQLARLAIWGVPAMLLLLSALHAERLARRLRPLLLLGDASYAIYLCHLPLIAMLVTPWSLWFGPIDGLGDALAFILAGLVLSAGFGTATHLLLEKPLDGWLRAQLTARRFGDVPAE